MKAAVPEDIPRIDIFRVFGVPRAWPLDASAARSAYYRLMKETHPDATSPLSKQEKQDTSAFLSRTYKKIRNDYQRGVYLYSLSNGVNLADRKIWGINRPLGLEGEHVVVVDTDKDKLVGCDRREMPAEFLDQVLYLEEAIEEAASLAAVEKLRGHVAALVDECKKNFADRQFLLRWRYYNRLLESAAKRTEQLEKEGVQT